MPAALIWLLLGLALLLLELLGAEFEGLLAGASLLLASLARHGLVDRRCNWRPAGSALARTRAAQVSSVNPQP